MPRRKAIVNLTRAVREGALPAFVFLLAAVFVSCSRGERESQARVVAIPHAGGVIQAQVWPARGGAGTVARLVLVHGAGHAAEVWRGLAERAAAAGFGVVGVELAALRSGAVLREADRAAAQEQVIAAAGAALEGAGTPEDVFLVGEGAGAGLVLGAARVLRPAAVVLLSPLSDSGGDIAAALEAVQTTPLLAFSAEDDLGARPAMEALDAMRHDYLELRVYAGTARGVDLLAVYPAVMEQILHWLRGVSSGGGGPLRLPG
jgi:alpha-beta hydrolase superfamily lysophospholipase